MKKKNIGETLRVFKFGLLQDLVTLLDFLEKEKIEEKELRLFVSSTIETQEKREKEYAAFRLEQQRIWNKNTRRCPTCMKPLALRAITTLKGKANREGYTCHWFCKEENCNFEEYTHEDFKEVYKKIMRGRR